MQLTKKEMIFQAVLSLMEEKPNVNNITISTIADRASIGKGTVYEYFDSKEEIFVETIIYCMSNVINECKAIQWKATLKENFHIIYQFIVNFLKNNRTPFYIMFLSPHIGQMSPQYIKKLQDFKIEFSQTVLAITLQIIQRAIGEGIIETSIKKEDAQFAFFSVIDMIVHKHFIPIRNFIRPDINCDELMKVNDDFLVNENLEEFFYDKLIYLLNYKK